MKIPITKPFFGEEEERAVVEPLRSGWVAQGPRVAEFEARFAAYTGAAHAIATTSATTALHLALVVRGIGSGDEVIVPAFTWVATANVVEMQGARPVFVDIDLATFNLDVDQIERVITPKTRAIIPVSLFGLACDIDAVNALARAHGLAVIEDDACATGAWIRGRHAGVAADMGCFSFHPRKAITTGEGGMVITADAATAAAVRSLRDHGASKSDLARHLGAKSYLLPAFDAVGYNYRMTDLQAAVGVVQIARLESLLRQRAAVAQRYDEALADVGALRLPSAPPDFVHGWQSYVTLFCPEPPSMANVDALHARRNALMDALESDGIATRPGTHAVHMLRFYRSKYGLEARDFPNACIADRLSIALPLYAQMTDEEQQYVIDRLRQRIGAAG
ncbi:MAG TPA: DegT/DnrJ/EryC1/StrS family aminotransferase [Thermoanaerobaculia bacterium]|jgi:dTDP-4-amino-4,6-dideoxygalactose transaminase